MVRNARDTGEVGHRGGFLDHEHGCIGTDRGGEVGDCVARLRGAGIRVSLFIDPDLPQIEAAAVTGAEMVELHTGAFANAPGDDVDAEIARLTEAARAAAGMELQVNAGHGLNYANLERLFAVPHLAELNIGHSIVARALRVGTTAAVREMKRAMAAYRG